jgi:Xaa-Pro aminopeptidase
MVAIFARRLKKLVRALNQQECSSALLLGSSAHRQMSGDQNFPFRQTSDLLYLTGSSHDEFLLLLSSKLERPLLIFPPVNKTKVLWEGPLPNLKRLAEELGADSLVSLTPEREVVSRLKATERLYFQNDSGSKAWNITHRLMEQPSHSRGSLPSQFHHADELLVPLRLYKDPAEIKLIRQAAEATNEALFDAIPMLAPGLTERFVAAAIDFFFRTRGCEPGFNTNVSTGVSAATLHHEPGSAELREGDLLLVDCGAARNHYSADITRVVPVSGTFSPVQAILYQGVLEAQKAALKKVKHGALIRDLYLAAAKPLTEALVETRVLRGKVSRLVEKGAFKPYFPHGIGHTLGLDVHDVGNLRGNNEAILEEGMVFTIEPGLYFPKPIGRIEKGLGIRIEDDVLVTRRGCEVLSEGFPKNMRQIEDLVPK